MNQLSIDLLKFIKVLRTTDSDVLIEHFKSYKKEEILKSVEALCGTTASNGYIVWHKPTRSDYPDYNKLSILPKGQSLIEK